MKNTSILMGNREALLIAVTFAVAAMLFIGMSVWATTIGTNMDATGTIGAATSTPWGTLAAEQTATQGIIDPTFVVGDAGTTTPFIFVSPKGVVSFGSTTPSPLFLNAADVVIGRNGSTNDLYISGGLGVGNATTADSNLEVQTRIYAGTVISTGSYFYSAGSATSTFASSGLSVGSGGLASSKGLVVSGGISHLRTGTLIGGTSTPALGVGLAIGSATAGTNVGTYISGGLGVGNATTSDGDFIVGAGNLILSYTSNGRLVVGATSSALTAPGAVNKFIFDGGEATFSSGGTGTTTFSILNEANADGTNACIQMSSDGLVYSVFVNGAGTGLSVELGSCTAH